MITYVELRELSLDFRRISSNLLSSTFETAEIQIQRFKSFIDNTPFISELLKKRMQDIEYDYSLCFKEDKFAERNEICPPVDEACHIKAMYDCLTDIVGNGSNVIGTAMSFYFYEGNGDKIIQKFVENAFKPLVDFINDAISREMIIAEEDNRNRAQLSQNIEHVHGTVIQQGSGNISTNTYVFNGEAESILNLIHKIMPSLDVVDDIPADIIDDVKDDLSVVDEQLSSQTPKKKRLQKAYQGIKKFVNDFLMKLAVTFATTVVTQTDWTNLLAQLETFISQI